MRKANKKDLALVVEILAKSFQKNPSVLWVVKKDKKINDRIKAVCRYSFYTVLYRDGVHISSDENGVALCYKYNAHKESLKDYWNQLILALKAIGLTRVFEVLKREAYMKKMRPTDGEFLYFWFYGVKPEAQNGFAAKELKNHIFQLADNLKLPVYLETSVEKNRRVYERYGFELYHTWPVKKQGINLYFMRRMPKS